MTRPRLRASLPDCGDRGIGPGFTLVEVLVVISIIGALIGLLLPAVQAAREAARRAHCINNLKQLGIAFNSYHDALGSYPTSFWRKTPNPPSGRFDGINRHSWCTLTLPFLEQSALHNSINFSLGIAGGPGNAHARANATALMSQLSAFICPSDPSPPLSRIPRQDSGVGINPDGSLARSGPKLSYQGNLGDNYIRSAGSWPFQGNPTTRYERLGAHGSHTGIMSRTGGTASISQVVDGTSTTFAIGESLFESCDWFTWPNPNGTISSSEVPLNLKIVVAAGGAGGHSSGDFGSCMGFRSAHAGVVNFLFCDGRVVSIRDTIDRGVYRALSTRGQNEIVVDW